MTAKEPTNKYVNSPNILRPTLVDFTDENFLKNALSNPENKKKKVTVIEIPPEWFNLHFEENNIKIECEKIKIETLMKQKFSKTKDADAFLFKSEEFVKNDVQSRKRKKKKTQIYSIAEYQSLIEQQDKKKDTSLSDDESYLKFLNAKNSMALYAPDVEYSFFNKDFYKGDKHWNLKNLKSIINRVKNENGETVPGIHTPFMYFGSTFSTFPSHREDGNFLSINVHYYGANKIWFVVNEEDAVRFQSLVNGILQGEYPDAECQNLMDHKLFVVTEKFLQKHKIHYTKVIQQPRTIVITHPFGIHGGFNLGFNINEAVNFATVESVKYFANYKTCDPNICTERVNLNGDKIIKEMYPTYGLENKTGKCKIRGNPDDPIVIKEKENQRNLNLAAGRKKLVEKRLENRYFSLDTIKHWLNFTLHNNPYPLLKHPNEKVLRAFTLFCLEKKHHLLTHERCSLAAFKSRISDQIYKPIVEGKKKFDLCDEDLKIIVEKYKK